MSSEDKIYVGAEQVDITVTTNKDLTNITALDMIFLKSEGTKITKSWPADVTIVTVGTGVVRYTTETGFLDTAGLWKIQVVGTFSDPRKSFTETRDFRIYPEFG